MQIILLILFLLIIFFIIFYLRKKQDFEPYCYIFGYGSLVNDNSTSSTLFNINLPDENINSLEKLIPNSQLISNSIKLEKSFIPCRIKGIKREWNFSSNIKTNSLSKSALYLGANIDDEKYICNGVLIPVTETQISILDKRESGYVKKEIDIKNIFIIENDKSIKNKKVFFYANDNNTNNDNLNIPIVQSYVDICLNGFINIDNKLGNTNYEFTKEFIINTYGWNNRWINDRIYSYRPHIFTPNANLINKILNETLPENILNNIIS